MLDWLFSEPLAVGTPAPDFSLLDQDGKPVVLSQLRGRNVVLVFYPADETPTCTKQLCEFRDQWEGVQAANAVVFGINSQSAAKHQQFKQNRQFPFPLLVDPGQKAARLYKANGLIVKRTVYLIGKDGVIRFAQRGKPEPTEVLKAAN